MKRTLEYTWHDKQTIRCPVCVGDGEVEVYGDWKTYTCPACNGKGVVSISITTKYTDETGFDFDITIDPVGCNDNAEEE